MQANDQDKPGKLYLIGAGPGDPELLTLKAVRIIASCDVLLYDRLVGRGVLAHARADAELVYVGKREGAGGNEQTRILDLVLHKVRGGAVVGRLKGGDPIVFGRGGEEWAFAEKHGIAVEYIPGISSAIAVPGLAGIPLTLRGISQSFAVVTGHAEEDASHNRWINYVHIDTLIVLMGAGRASTIAQLLIAAGRSTHDPVALLSHGSLPDARNSFGTLQGLADGELVAKSPAVLVIGAVAGRRGQ